ncbi:hypothetical protein [Phenylobacterium aquaticum]|uniref:hypothetical protein n=1 Tax=Phenylobacterium aquaticum TaxID=1763816 RepID=UPI001F5DF56D|nr:hypothetical protein [Phenylobacterium aquaticum]MCI3132152.1 hypothetical protein [Phenylobacterium aquaticum]
MRLNTGLAAAGLALAVWIAGVAAPAHAAAPVLAVVRKGPVLTLTAGGKPVARFTNSAALEWIEVGGAVIKTAAGPKPVFTLSPNYPNPQDEEEAGDQPNYLFDETGRLFWMIEGQFNPGKSVLLVNQHETFAIDDYEARFSLEDFTRTPHLKFAFKSNCYVEDWVSDTELKARCPRTTARGPVVETDAVVRKVSPTQWRLTEKALPKAKLQVGPTIRPPCSTNW